jgi:hypothetical protein
MNHARLDAGSVPPAASMRAGEPRARSSISLVRALDFVRAADGVHRIRHADSHAMICCVRSAKRRRFLVGSASASSRPLQCSDCAPPSTAANACNRHAHQVVVGLLCGQACCRRSVHEIEAAGRRGFVTRIVLS